MSPDGAYAESVPLSLSLSPPSVIQPKTSLPSSSRPVCTCTLTRPSLPSHTARYSNSLSAALSYFRRLVSTPHSRSWKPVLSPTSSSSATPNSPNSPNATSTAAPARASSDASSFVHAAKGKGRSLDAQAAHLANGIGPLDPSQVRVHKRKGDKDLGTGVEIVRAVAEIPVAYSDDGGEVLELFRAVLGTPELRAQWDKLVEQATTLELLDPQTRVTKTDYRLGWPASPRDTITISRLFSDPTTLIDLSTSLPRSADEPAFLRPAPPYVRSTTHLFAWCLQLLPPSPPSPSLSHRTTPSGSSSFLSLAPGGAAHYPRLRITLFWSWSLRLPSTSLSSSTPHLAHVPHLLASLVSFTRENGSRLPLLSGYGSGVELNSDAWEEGEERRTVEYAVVRVRGQPNEKGKAGDGEGDEEQDDDEDEEAAAVGGNLQGLDELMRRRERRRLARAIEISLPCSPPSSIRDGWDVRVSVKALGGSLLPSSIAPSSSSDEPTWSSTLETPVLPSSSLPSSSPSRHVLRITHASVLSSSHLVRAKVTVQRLAGGKGVRVNGQVVERREVEARDPRRFRAAGGMGKALEPDDASSIRGGTLSNHNGDTDSVTASPSSDLISVSPASQSAFSQRSATNSPPSPPSSQAQIAALLRRSYIYFLSLLQEPPAKWRHVADSSGVSVTQLLSPDPTLTIYRAEAVFVGVGVWDVFATVATPGARRSWDRALEDARLVEDEDGGAGELSELWWEKKKGGWPVAPRDSVTLRTAYKSPSSVHIFSFSTDDTSLFPSIPPPELGTIRTQTDLYGWSIEALSPTTTQITLLDQSDPKGWSNKSWTPTQLIQAVAGVRDFSIKYGAPPVVTRMAGARKTRAEYDHDKGTFRVEYELAAPFNSHSAAAPGAVELELRCDISTWATSLDVVVDPPPSSVACLSRHRLSSGGGLWLTIEHPPGLVDSEGRVAVTVRRGPPSSARGGEKGSVTINGARAKVDIEVLEEDKVRELEKRKRVKVSPVPLDQYETLGVRVWNAIGLQRTGSPAPDLTESGAVGGAKEEGGGKAKDKALQGGGVEVEKKKAGVEGFTDVPQAGGKAAANATGGGRAGEAISTLTAPGSPNFNPSSDASSALDPTSTAVPAPLVKPPLDPPACALEALAWLQSFHAEQGPELTDPAPGWAIVSERSGTVVRKKLLPRVSDVFPVYRGDKIVQGLTADEIASVVTAAGCRKMWDERVESATTLASYGHGIETSAIATKPTFPFKGRIFYVATIKASVKVPSASSTSSTSTVLFVASASYTPCAASDVFDPLKVNPASLLPGQVLLEGWILETLDPYTSSVLAIPSTRCTYVACVDQKGSVPLALNQVLNANLARSIGNVEALGKQRGPLPRVWAPAPGVQVEGPLSDDGEVDCVWKLSDGNGGGAGGPSQVVTADFEGDDASFRALFRVGGKGRAGAAAEAEQSTTGAGAGAGTVATVSDRGKAPPKSFLSPSIPVGSNLLKSELPRSASLTFGLAAPPILQKPPITSELSHKSSRSSLRSKSPPAPPVATGSSSPTKPNGANSSRDLSANDLIVAELVVDLKQYPHGYSIVACSSLITPSTLQFPAPVDPLSLEPLPPRSLAPSAPSAAPAPPLLPLSATAHDAPLPSILTASLDAWKRANHLVRISIPTSPITHPLQDPLRDSSKTKLDRPEWFKLLTAEGGGALIEVKIVPLPAGPAHANEKEKERVKQGGAVGAGTGEKEGAGSSKVTGQAARTVMFNGEKVVVQSQKESRAVLARFEDEDAPLQGAKISRVPPRKRKTSVPTDVDPASSSSSSLLPVELQQPLAVAVRLLAPKPATPIVDDFEFPDPKSPGAVTPSDETGPRSPIAAGALPAMSRRSTATSDAAPVAGPLSAILGAYPLARLGSSIVNATVPTADSSTFASGIVVARRTYSLGFVIAVAIIAFLLGSLLRSLLTPADYIIYRPDSAAQHGHEVEQALLQAFDPNRRWREAKRLVELRTTWMGVVNWDLIVAAVRRE
ncbi:hypothetical protein JCM21900_006489 [Sporobolomyces salmonicolor]